RSPYSTAPAISDAPAGRASAPRRSSGLTGESPSRYTVDGIRRATGDTDTAEATPTTPQRTPPRNDTTMTPVANICQRRRRPERPNGRHAQLPTVLNVSTNAAGARI